MDDLILWPRAGEGELVPVTKGSASKDFINSWYLWPDPENKHQEQEGNRATQEDSKDEDLEENEPAKFAAAAVLEDELAHLLKGLVEDLGNRHGDGSDSRFVRPQPAKAMASSVSALARGGGLGFRYMLQKLARTSVNSKGGMALPWGSPTDGDFSWSKGRLTIFLNTHMR